MQSFQRLKLLLTRFYSGILRAESHYAFAVRQYRETILQKELQADRKLVTPYGWSGYSQNDEDGIVQEIFRRIGTKNNRFLEFGAGDPLCNTGTYLLLSGWSGEWLDANSAEILEINRRFRAWIKAGYLSVVETFVTPDNINSLSDHLAKDLDFCVIDIDGNDYHVWKALTAVRPRVVMIEYNAVFRPPVAVVQPYVKEPFWHGENFYGASLKALEYLGREKGYVLVGCNLCGTNAFFIQEDIAADHFSAPYTAEHHYRQQWIDLMAWGYARQVRSVGTGAMYEIVSPPEA